MADSKGLEDLPEGKRQDSTVATIIAAKERRIEQSTDAYL